MQTVSAAFIQCFLSLPFQPLLSPFPLSIPSPLHPPSPSLPLLFASVVDLEGFMEWSYSSDQEVELQGGQTGYPQRAGNISTGISSPSVIHSLGQNSSYCRAGNIFGELYLADWSGKIRKREIFQIVMWRLLVSTRCVFYFRIHYMYMEMDFVLLKKSIGGECWGLFLETVKHCHVSSHVHWWETFPPQPNLNNNGMFE